MCTQVGARTRTLTYTLVQKKWAPCASECLCVLSELIVLSVCLCLFLCLFLPSLSSWAVREHARHDPTSAILALTTATYQDTHARAYLSLLVENGLGLTTEAGLLAVITALALGVERVLTLLVLGDLPLLVALALVAIGLHLLGEVHHCFLQQRGGCTAGRGGRHRTGAGAGK